MEHIKFLRTLERFAERLRNAGEFAAAEAVKTVAKFVRNSGPCRRCVDDHDLSGLISED